MTKPLKKMIEEASLRAEIIFTIQGHVAPMYHIVCTAGEGVVSAPMPDNKDASVAIMRELLAEMKATRVLFISEAWSLHSSDHADEAFAKTRSLEHHPNRTEIILFAGEDRTEGLLHAERKIVRKAGHAALGPLQFTTSSGTLEGRMVGLLPTDGSAH